MIFIGVYVSGMSTGFFPIDMEKLNAPLWVLFLVGAVFLVGGIMLVIGDSGSLNDFLAAIILLAMGSIGAWISFFGDSAQMSGGLFFLSREANVQLSRFLFGFGSLITFMVSIYAMRRCIRNLNNNKINQKS